MNKKKRHFKLDFKNYKWFLLSLSFFLIFSLFFISNNLFNITGHTILEKETNYTAYLNLTFNQTSVYTWYLENPGNLKNIKITGGIITDGFGSAKVFIEKDNAKYLIFDSDKLGIDKMVTIQETTDNEMPKVIIDDKNKINFTDICVETCLLNDFDQPSYNLIIEIENAVLIIDSIGYTLVTKEVVTATEIEKLNKTKEEFHPIQAPPIHVLNFNNTYNAKQIYKDNYGNVYYIKDASQEYFFYQQDLKNNFFINNKGEIITSGTSISSLENKDGQNTKWIIEFKDEPLVVFKIKSDQEIKDKEKELGYLEKTSGIKVSEISSLRSEIADLKAKAPIKLQDYKEKIKTQHRQAFEDIEKIRAKDVLKIQEEARLKEYFKTFNGIALEISQEEIEKIKLLPYVKGVFEDKEVRAFLNESVPLINADKVWDLKDVHGRNITGQNVTIAVIDTGIDYTHFDLGNCTNVTFLAGNCSKVVGGYDFVNYDEDPMDDNGHGTHVSATAAGNGTLRGVAPDAQLYGYKVLDAHGSGYFSWVISGIERAVDPNQDDDFSDHADIISMSLGGGGDPDDPVSLAIDNAVNAGVVAIIAAGNDGPRTETIGSPGTARKAITVGATDKNDIIASFSSRGPVIWDGKSLIKPDIVAPGVSICAARWDNAWSGRECHDSNHVAISGTSMATPHVSGVAALLLQEHPEWNPEDVKSALMLTAKDLGYDPNTQGAGRVDALKALNPEILVSLPVINLENVIGQSAVTGKFNITSLAEESISLTLYFSNISDFEGNVITDNLVNISQPFFILDPGQKQEVEFTINLTTLPDGQFYGLLNISTAASSYHVTFAFEKMHSINVKIISSKFSSEDLAPSFFIYNNNLTVIKSASSVWDFGGDNYTFRLPSGNYTIVAKGGGDIYSPDIVSYVLQKEIEINESEISKSVILDLDEAKSFRINTTSLKGKPLDRFGWNTAFVHCKNYIEQPTFEDFWEGGNCTVTSMGWSGFGFQGEEVIIYLNDFDVSKNNTVFIHVLGVPSRLKGKHKADLDSLSPSDFFTLRETFEVSDEAYVLDWKLHSIDEFISTSLNYDESKFETLNVVTDYPGYKPEEFPNYITFIGAPMASGAGGMLSSFPMNRTFYFGMPDLKSWFSFWTLINYLPCKTPYECWLFGNYNQEISEHFYSSNVTFLDTFNFGVTPYSFGNFSNSASEIIFGGPVIEKESRIVYSHEKKFFVWKYPEFVPLATVYARKDGSLIDAQNLSSESYMLGGLTEGTYVVNMTFYLLYGIMNETIITATFDIPSEDINPPYLENLEVSPRFKPGSSMQININMQDDNNLASVYAYYYDTEWKEIELSNINGIYKGFITPTDVEKIDLRVEANDSAGNTVTYTLLPVSLRAHEIVLDFVATKESATPGELIHISARLQDPVPGTTLLSPNSPADLGGKKVQVESITESEASISVDDLTESFAIGEKNVVNGLDITLKSIAEDYWGDLWAAIETPYNYIPRIRVNYYINNQFLDSDRTYDSDCIDYYCDVYSENFSFKKGESTLDYTIPFNYTANTINFTIEFEGAGGYAPTNQTLTLDVIREEHNLIITDLTLSEFKLNQQGDINATLYNIGLNNEKDITVKLIINGQINNTIIIPELNSSNWQKINFNWTPTIAGKYNITLFAEPVAGETRTEDNSIASQIFLGPDVTGYIPYPGLIVVNKSTNITAYISNEGSQTALNVNASLFYKFEEGDYIQIGSIYLGSLEAQSSRESIFNWKPTNAGSYQLKLVLNASDDGNWDNNIDYSWVNVKMDAPDLSGWISYQSPVVVNKSTNITAYISNEGSQTALNVNASLFYKFEEGDYVLVNSTYIGSLAAQDSIESIFNWVPGLKGGYTLKLFVNTTNESNWNDNTVYSYIDVKIDAPDVTGYFWIADSIPINQSTNIGINIENIGAKTADNITVKLFDNQTLINSSFIEQLEADDYRYFNYYWTPTLLGDHILNLVINASNDGDLTNNFYNRTIVVYRQINSTFNITDHIGNFVRRLIVTETDDYWIENLTTVPMPEAKQDIWIAYLNETDQITIATRFMDSEISSSMNAISEYYEHLRDKYAILANKVSWNYNDTRFVIEHENISKILNDTANLTVFTCETWDFSNKYCMSNWINASDVDIGLYDNYLSGEASAGKAQAFALGKPYIDLDNGIVGLPENVQSRDILNLTIDNSTNLTKQFNGTLNVKFGAENKTLVEFAFNFSKSKLFLPNITILTQSANESKGSILIKGITLTENQTKTAYLDHIDLSLSTVCVKDAEVSSITEMSNSCNAIDEKLIACDGNLYDNYTCTLIGDQFKVTGLVHSAVKEQAPLPAAPAPSGGGIGGGGGIYICNENWQCSNWSICKDGIQTRNCIDLNHCNTTVRKPSEQQGCAECINDTDCISKLGENYECKENVCIKKEITKAICGNKICEDEETIENCCLDCGCPAGQKCLMTTAVFIPGVLPAPPIYQCIEEKKLVSFLAFLISLIALIFLIIAMTATKKIKRRRFESKFQAHIEKYIDRGFNSLKAKDVNDALKCYGLIRKCYEDYQGRLSKKERKEIYGKIIVFYNQILKIDGDALKPKA